MADAIKVEGLKEFRSNLKAMDKNLPKALRLAFNEAADLVVADARPRVPSRTGRARGTVKARSTQTMARVVGGGNRAPYYPWLDFGGRVGRGKQTKRPVLADGRYIYPAFRANRTRFTDKMSDSLIKVARSAGIEVT